MTWLLWLIPLTGLIIANKEHSINKALMLSTLQALLATLCNWLYKTKQWNKQRAVPLIPTNFSKHSSEVTLSTVPKDAETSKRINKDTFPLSSTKCRSSIKVTVSIGSWVQNGIEMGQGQKCHSVNGCQWFSHCLRREGCKQGCNSLSAGDGAFFSKSLPLHLSLQNFFSSLKY